MGKRWPDAARHEHSTRIIAPSTLDYVVPARSGDALLPWLRFIPWLTAIEYGHLTERHFPIGPETVPRVGWYHYDVSRFGDDVDSVDCIDASSFVYDEHLAATMAMPRRAASRWMGAHREDQIKTVLFAAEKPPVWMVGGGLHVRRFDKRRQRFDHRETPIRGVSASRTYFPIRVHAAGKVTHSATMPDQTDRARLALAMLLRRLPFIPWVSAIEYGHVAERHLAIGPETVPSVRWYHYDVSRVGDDVRSVDSIDASSFDQDEHLAAAVAMLRRAVTRRMSVHGEDQIKTVTFAAENSRLDC
jgi:hypothetical protein